MLNKSPHTLRDNGSLEITAAHYPACKHAIAFTGIATGEAGAATSFSDLIGDFDLSINAGTDVIFTGSQYGDCVGLGASLDKAAGNLVAMVSGKTRLIFYYQRLGISAAGGKMIITSTGGAPAVALAGYQRLGSGAWTVSNGANGGGGGGTGVSAAITGTANDGTKAIMDVLAITVNDASGLQLASFDGTTMTNPAAVALNATVITGIPAITVADGAATFYGEAYPGFFAVVDVPVKPTARELTYYCAWMYDAIRNNSAITKTNNGKVLPPELLIYS